MSIENNTSYKVDYPDFQAVSTMPPDMKIWHHQSYKLVKTNPSSPETVLSDLTKMFATKGIKCFQKTFINMFFGTTDWVPNMVCINDFYFVYNYIDNNLEGSKTYDLYMDWLSFIRLKRFMTVSQKQTIGNKIIKKIWEHLATCEFTYKMFDFLNYKRLSTGIVPDNRNPFVLHFSYNSSMGEDIHDYCEWAAEQEDEPDIEAEWEDEQGDTGPVPPQYETPPPYVKKEPTQ